MDREDESVYRVAISSVIKVKPLLEGGERENKFNQFLKRQS